MGAQANEPTKESYKIKKTRSCKLVSNKNEKQLQLQLNIAKSIVEFSIILTLMGYLVGEEC